ncbi:DUF2946 family protein [Palleronia sp. LCG004]|uniref:DUF2946 family protein n=1 Tax=Palleronia sp. LCG004 TaxID=3079304 RepID=UPI002942138A|nr:DUF2946 family protein [Palleronia sp. LCG004]WOI56097.1 hypothetical protein RVY76_13845 [Palleronia sp. LCG004]
MPFRRTLLLATLLVVALASVVSAAAMAPERGDGKLAAYLASGGSLHDLCADHSSHEDHHCPFCHAVPGPPTVRFAPSADRVVCDEVGRDRGHQAARPLAGNPYLSARAPPQPG